MNISFYTAAVGAQMQQERLDVHGNNVANVNTYGFRARIPAFSSLMTYNVRGINEDVVTGVGSKLEDAETDFRGTALKGTDRPLDFAINGDGFFALVDPGTGDISYTRDGSFTMSDFIDEDGETRWYLSDGLGRFVLGMDGRRIELTGEEDTGGIGEFDLDVGVFDFINHNGMLHIGDNRMIPVEKNGQVMLGSGVAVPGYLEMSNTDLAYEIAKVIESQRSFQYMLRMVTTSDEIETTVNNLR